MSTRDRSDSTRTHHHDSRNFTSATNSDEHTNAIVGSTRHTSRTNSYPRRTRRQQGNSSNTRVVRVTFGASNFSTRLFVGNSLRTLRITTVTRTTNCSATRNHQRLTTRLTHHVPLLTPNNLASTTTRLLKPPTIHPMVTGTLSDGNRNGGQRDR